MVIVETSKEFRKFAKTFNKFDSIVIPIECDFNKHPKDTRLCLLYVKTMSKDSKEYILPFRHSDTINLEPHDIDNIWTTKNVYTYDKKKLLHFFDWKNTHDVQMNYYLEKNEPLSIDDILTNAHEYFYRKYYGKSNINCVIPIMKHLEWCRNVVEVLKKAGVELGKNYPKLIGSLI